MRIHYIVTSLENGGAEFSIPAIAQVVQSLGHEFRVFACEPRDRGAESRLVKAGVAYEVMSERDAYKPASILRFANAVRKSRPDVIWTSLSHATRVGQVVGAMFGIPVVSWKHSADAKPSVLKYHRSSKLWIADSGDVEVYLRCVMGVEPDRIVTWPLFNPALDESRLPQWDGAGPLRIGSAGRLHPQKNYEAFVRAIDRLRWEDPQTFSKIEVSIAGDGPLREGLDRLIKSLGLEDRFKLMGWVSDIPAYLRGLHLYVQPSLYEGMCIASHEAMAAGLPVIATPVGEMRRSVQPGVTGVLLKGDIVSELADAIRGFVTHPSKLADFGANGRDYVMRTMGDGAFAQNGAKVLALIEKAVMN